MPGGLRQWVLLVAFLAPGGLPVRAERVTYQDGHGDAVARRTDNGADGQIGEPEHALPDLLSWSIGTWRPTNAQADLFVGSWSNMGGFFRLELVFAGVVNPPGPLGCCGEPTFDPFKYGPNPVSGYVELNIDGDQATGGELEFPDLRYFGNTSRFGGHPQPASLAALTAVDARAFDGNLATSPFVERSGEDFHLELTGWEIDAAQIQRSDASDWLFGSGETWVVPGHLLHRAHGYSRFSSACCRSGVPVGNYEPRVKLQFSHQVVSDRTTISLVYPLTNAACAAMRGESYTEAMDVLFTNQHSIQESLWELVIAAMSATPQDEALPEFALIAAWENKNPDAFLDPAAWQVRCLLGGHYTSQQESLFVWSDIYPDVLLGDLDGNGVVNNADLNAFDAYLALNDGNPAIDADGASNATLEIKDFGPGFSLFDLNYDGLVDADDRVLIGGPLLPRADYDHDGDVDQADFGHLQICLSGQEPPRPGCRNADLSRDNRIDQSDLALFITCASGPGVPANPACGRP